jgi:hypothetical protein
MSTLVLDIETVGGYTEGQAAAVLEMAEAKGMEPDAFAALCPPLARVVCVAALNLSSKGCRVWLDGDVFGEPAGPSAEPNHVFCAGEAELLRTVNQALAGCTRLVTFNGRCFDLPVLVHRSIANGVTPSSKLLQAAREYRFKPNLHIDLREQFTFFGAANTGTLRAFCLGYGLDDPKAGGGGADVAQLVREKEHRKLGNYCLGDVLRTGTLYQRWQDAAGLA